MHVRSFTILIDTINDQDTRTEDIACALEGLVVQIREYGIPNQDGARLNDRNGHEIGQVGVKTCDYHCETCDDDGYCDACGEQ